MPLNPGPQNFHRCYYGLSFRGVWVVSFASSIALLPEAIASASRGQPHTHLALQVFLPPESAQNPSILSYTGLILPPLTHKACFCSTSCPGCDALTLYLPHSHTVCISVGLAGNLSPSPPPPPCL